MGTTMSLIEAAPVSFMTATMSLTTACVSLMTVAPRLRG